MASVNKVILVGRVGQDPEAGQTQAGKSFASFGLATTKTYKDQKGEKQKNTEWHKIVLWNRVAEVAEQYVKKGSLVCVEGEIRYKKFKNKEGIEKQHTEIMGINISLLDSRTEDNKSENQEPWGEEKIDSGLPF
jgi:single-strand DNA-binding protein